MVLQHSLLSWRQDLAWWPLILKRPKGGSSCLSPHVGILVSQQSHKFVWLFLLSLSWISLSCPSQPRIRASKLVNWMAIRAPQRHKESMLGQQWGEIATQECPFWDGHHFHNRGENHRSLSRLCVSNRKTSEKCFYTGCAWWQDYFIFTFL